MAYRAEDIDRGIDPRIMICELSSNYMPCRIRDVSIPAPQPFVKYFEDPRLFEHKGRLWMAFAAAAMLNKHHFACQGVALLTDDFKIEKVFYPDLGFNHNQISKANSIMKREKNWTFISIRNEIHIIYTINPLKVAVMDDVTGSVKVISESHFKDTWIYGRIHGSTGLVENDGKYLGMFHSFLIGKDSQRSYCAGFYEVDLERFRVTMISRAPFLEAARDASRDIRSNLQPYRPNAIFPCGIIIEKEKVIISYGWQDCRCMIAIEDLNVVKKSMVNASYYSCPQDAIRDTMACVQGGMEFTADGKTFRANHWAGVVREAKKHGINEPELWLKVRDQVPSKYKEKRWLPETL